MWVMGVPYGENRIVLFDYDASRSGAVVERLFADYEGTVQTDGYAGYNVLSANKKITQIGCNMHGRRYFEQAFKMGAQSGSSLAEVALRYYQRLYAIEEHIRKKPPEERGQWRQQQARPIWMEFKRWAEENSQKVPPKSKLGVAFHYFLSQNDRLQGYLNDGKLEMDNGFIERAIRKFAIGRNNWLFADTTAGADASALFYSLLITAKINGVNPYEALKQIFNELPTAKSIADFERIADIILPLPSPH
jgi:transposase